MPYKSEKIKLSETQDRRRKLTKEQKEEIKTIYATGVCGTRPLAKQFKVSRSLIQIIVNPSIAQKRKEYTKNNWAKYKATREERAEIQREHRRYKQELYVKGELKK